MKNNQKPLRVAGAILLRERADGAGKEIFATQRGYGEWKGWWELPGGKIEPGETPEQALVREMREELDAEIRIDKYFDTVEYDYPTFHLSMDCFLCTLKSGQLRLKEHLAASWLDKDSLGTVSWLPADLELVEKLRQLLSNTAR